MTDLIVRPVFRRRRPTLAELFHDEDGYVQAAGLRRPKRHLRTVIALGVTAVLMGATIAAAGAVLTRQQSSASEPMQLVSEKTVTSTPGAPLPAGTVVHAGEWEIRMGALDFGQTKKVVSHAFNGPISDWPGDWAWGLVPVTVISHHDQVASMSKVVVELHAGDMIVSSTQHNDLHPAQAIPGEVDLNEVAPEGKRDGVYGFAVRASDREKDDRCVFAIRYLGEEPTTTYVACR